MSNLSFSASEIRVATAALCAATLSIPAIYYLTSSSSGPQDSTPHMRTFQKLLQAYSTLRPQALAANASADFTHQALPASLEMPTRTLDPWKQHATMIFALFEEFSMVPQPPGDKHSVHFCRETNTVIAHCKMGGKVNGDNENGRKLIQAGLTEWWTECVGMQMIARDSKGSNQLNM
ncbi:hypothetical protein K491DRAFT_692286 [Lophiostoma macrostomum CBS 122681]|uniref:Uncharacterized protein n=1 Tax=Lophiostoma macrostomum CBS 122681 TaxID=1314788 RepID=A0A6A6T7W7_9PLEO|nr:hypothetical protein K491DRAFT_692286 [Lophiostoma macrostomum CBS 122681]